MKRHRLLLLAHFFPPLAGGGVHRVLSFVQRLPEHGWDCTVICAGEHDYWVRDESLLARVPAGTEVIRVSGASALAAWLRVRREESQGKRRGSTFAGLRALADWWLLPDPYVGWSKRAAKVARERIARGDIDAVLSTSPPDSAHLAALEALDAASGRMRSPRGFHTQADAAAGRVHLPDESRVPIPFVCDFRDPWVGLHWRTPPTSWHRARQAAMEKRVLERADLVLTASQTHLGALGRESGARVQRAEHLPNGYEPEPVPAPDADPLPAAPGVSPATPEPFRIVFTGTLALMEDLNTLLEAVHEVLARLPEARRRLRVDLAGPYDMDLADRAEALGLTGIVRFLGARTHAESRALQRAADVLMLWKPHGEGFAAMVPGKTYEYLDSGRPVVALLPASDEVAGLITRAKGRVLAPGDRDALARELETRYTTWKEQGRAPDVRPEWLEEYARPRLAARLAGLLDRLIGTTGGAA
jgi:glycosyltransferase involved in cell wall biosynthesis